MGIILNRKPLCSTNDPGHTPFLMKPAKLSHFTGDVPYDTELPSTPLSAANNQK